MFIQFPILWAMYYVIRNIPAYVGQVKAVYTPILTSIMAQDGWQKVMEKIGEAKPILMSASKYDYSDKNVLIDVLYKFQTSTWETLGKKLPDLRPTIDSTVDTLKSMNNFLGLNIAETPMNLISNGVKAGAWGNCDHGSADSCPFRTFPIPEREAFSADNCSYEQSAG